MDEDFTLITFHGYVMRGDSIDRIAWKVFPTIKKIVKNLHECLGKHFENLVSDPMFTAVATILDMGAYAGESADAIYKAATTIVERFKPLLEKNAFNFDFLSMLFHRLVILLLILLVVFFCLISILYYNR